MSEQSAATANPATVSPLRVAEATGDATRLSDFVSMQDAATRLGISKRTLQRAIQRGELIAVKQGRAVLVSTTAIADYHARRQQDATPAPLLARPLLHLVDLSLDDLSDLVDRVSLPAPHPPPLEAPAAPMLPAPLTAFIGRSAEIAAVSALLVRDDVRLVTLTGVGGVGKTRLALRVASLVRERFPDGAAFVPLASVREADLVLPAIVQALGLHDGVAQSPIERLRSFIQRKRLLLVLDNFEHVTGAGPTIVELLTACPELTMLVTSRTLLRVSGERPFAVQPMHLAQAASPGDGNGATGLAELGQVESIQLFVERAQAARPSFALTAEQAPAVAAICARLEGLPLAIELAAARCAVLTPVTMLARLDQRLPMLTGGPRDQPDRLRTMRNAIAWSHDLLNPAEQAFFRRLAVFAGGISLDAAEAIAQIPTIVPGAGTTGVVPIRSQSAPAIFDLLESLVDGTLLQPIELANGDQRYTMLETVREYALEQLVRAGEEDLAREAQASHFAAIAQDAGRELRRTASEEVITQTETEHDNFRAALIWSLAANPELALRLSSSLAPFWDKRGHWDEGRAWLDRALASARDLPPTREYAAALAAAGMMAGLQRESALAKRLWTESQTLATELGAPEVAAPALRGLGIIASNESEFAQATKLFEEALAGYRAVADQDMIGRCLSDLGLVAARQGDLAQAIRYDEEALVYARTAGNQWQVCIVLGNLGGVFVDNGDFARGEVMTAEALELSRQLGDTYGVAIGLYNLGNIFNEREDASAAIAHYQEMLPIAHQLGELQLLTRALDRIGLALHRFGANRPAARLFGATAAAREASGDTLFEQEADYFAAIWQLVRDALGDTMYDAVWESGRSVPLDQAVAEATVFAQSVTAVTIATTTDAASSAAIIDAGLTKREIEVLRLVAAGRSDRDIADVLFVARTTASKHVSAILDKLQAGSRTEAVAIALRDRML